MAADINPKQDPDGAYQWALARLAEFRDRQLELEALFYTLGQQITWGVIRCQDVIDYNRDASDLFNASVDFFTWIKPLAVEIQRQTGVAIAPFVEVPLPQLIGTKYLIFDRGGGHKQFDAGVTCDAAGGFSPQTPRNQLQLGPTPTVSTCLSGALMHGTTTVTPAPRRTMWSPYPTITDLRLANGVLGFVPGGGAGGAAGAGAAPVPGGGWAAVIQTGLKVVGLLLILKIAERVLSTLDGTKALEIQAASQAKNIEADYRRNECANDAFAAIHGPDIPDLAERLKVWDKMVADCERLIPKREDVSLKWWQGLTGVAIAGGLAFVAVALIQSRGRGHDSSKED